MLRVVFQVGIKKEVKMEDLTIKTNVQTVANPVLERDRINLP